MDVLLHQFREHLVLALEFLLKSLDLLLQMRVDSLWSHAVESSSAILKELFLPAIKDGRVQVVLVAQIRDRDVL